ncbi:hypothetical protein [Shimia sp. R9_3]|uniref:hypothetical protein n=1 Tax=Shimia sp. R9_3 TaxID=2821113 RepID=UPI001AD9E604|nr:hypothetical protein [Shimia sp. R9_3]MBO9402662.1 hypothetical protein [Shimia sp. R9_3]
MTANFATPTHIARPARLAAYALNIALFPQRQRCNLLNKAPAGEALARRLDEYEFDPALDSVNLMFFVDPAQVDLSFTSLTSKNWDDVTLTETETRIVVAEVQRLLDAHFQASREVSDLASSVLSGCPSR